jgi:hypothetical protein
MSHISQQAGILIHQRDLRVGSLSEFEEFWQSSRTRLNQSSENSIEPEWILAELPCSSYSEDSRKAEKSSGPQNLTSLSTLQRLNLEGPWGGGAKPHFLHTFYWGEHRVIYRRSKAVLWSKIGHVKPTCQAGRPCNLATQGFLLAPPLGIGYLEYRLF